MSTPATPAAPTPAVPMTLKVISHTGLFYWWPVWLVGFLLAGLTYWEGTRLAVLPAGTTVKADTATEFAVSVKGAAADLEEAAANTAQGQEAFPIRIGSHKGHGLIWCAVILLVVFGSNVPLRGLATLVAALAVVLLIVLFASLEWWTPILDYMGGLHVQISIAGYLLPSTALLILWLVTTFLIDPLRYATFSAGQLTLRKDVGDHVEVYTSTTIHVEKRPTDLLRHWILGFGAGDLIITVPGRSLQIELPNVLFVDSRMAIIAQLMKLQPIMTNANA